MSSPDASLLFRLEDPIPLLEAYAYRTAVQEFIDRLRSKHPDGHAVQVPLEQLVYNVQLAEFEHVHLCALFDLSERMMLDDNALIDFIDRMHGRAFPLTAQSIGMSRLLLQNLDPTNEIVNARRAELGAMKKELTSFARSYAHPTAQALLGNASCWNDDEIDEYFSLFPLEEVRLPLVAAVNDLRSHGLQNFWTMSEVITFGNQVPEQKRATSESILLGESWQDALAEDDDEPWKK